MYSSKLLLQLPQINHTFFGRKGGVSSGVFASLNASYRVPDLVENVAQNHKIISKHFNLASKQLLILHQIHSNKIIQISNTTNLSNISNIKADGMITKSHNLILGIVTADCIPILLAHKTMPYIAAIHCGWQGLINGILPNIITKFNQLGCQSKDLIIAIGPCIHQQSYEVDSIFYNNFSPNKNYLQFFTKISSNKFLFNLPACATYILTRLNILLKNIDVLPYDTYSNADLFFSHRRTTHQQAKSRGLQISCINLKIK